MKFMLIVLGLNAANANYSCIWCEIHKEKRYDMSVSNESYTGSNMRTLEKMRRCQKQKSIAGKKGCVHSPLVEIEPKDCLVDELHLFLCITDILFKSFFIEMYALVFTPLAFPITCARE